jgi:hypothetical protein
MAEADAIIAIPWVVTARMRPERLCHCRTSFEPAREARRTAASRHAGGGGYVTTKQSRERDGEPWVRTKRVSEPHGRVARESDLAREIVALQPRPQCPTLKRSSFGPNDLASPRSPCWTDEFSPNLERTAALSRGPLHTPT